MPRAKPIFKKRKGPNVNRRWNTVGIQAQSNESTNSNLFLPSFSSCSVSSVDTSSTSSVSKAKLGSFESTYDKYLESSNFQYDIIDLKELEKSLQNIAVCKICKGALVVKKKKVAGLAANIGISCSVCEEKVIFSNSKSVKCNDKVFYDVNIRLVYGMRCIGKGKTSANIFCGVMNLPSPPFRFFTHENLLATTSEKVCKSFMKKAVEETVVANDNSRDLTVALDGSWQKRGHTSLNGILSATSVLTGKVVDIEIMSKFCKCLGRVEGNHEATCEANYIGTSGGMEVSGALEIFKRSVPEYNVRYVRYLGDGDSRAFESVNQAKPYGEEVTIEKQECIGHVQKRFGTRLRELKKKKLTLPDGTKVFGRNGLTNAGIAKLQNYYGLAIRRGAKKSVTAMRQEIWASFFHVCATNETPQRHGLCTTDPAEIWCKFKKAELEHKNYDYSQHFHLPGSIMNAIKPIYKDLSQTALLEKCLGGKTQNPNESLNNVVWAHVPKRTFVRLQTLKFGVYEAVITFNEGHIGKCELFTQLGLKPGNNLVNTMKKRDEVRVKEGEKVFQEIEKKLRHKRAVARKKLEDEYEAQEDPDQPSYAPGRY